MYGIFDDARFILVSDVDVVFYVGPVVLEVLEVYVEIWV